MEMGAPLADLDHQAWRGTGALPGGHLEEPTIGSHIVEPEHDLVIGEHGLVTLGPCRKLGVDECDDELKPEVRVLAHDGQQVDLLPVVQRFEHPVVVDEPRRYAGM